MRIFSFLVFALITVFTITGCKNPEAVEKITSTTRNETTATAATKLPDEAATVQGTSHGLTVNSPSSRMPPSATGITETTRKSAAAGAVTLPKATTTKLPTTTLPTTTKLSTTSTTTLPSQSGANDADGDGWADGWYRP